MMDNEAQRRRKQNASLNIWGLNEILPFSERFAWKEIVATMWRPYFMLLTEPIVGFLSLLSGFSDALIFSKRPSLHPIGP